MRLYKRVIADVHLNFFFIMFRRYARSVALKPMKPMHSPASTTVTAMKANVAGSDAGSTARNAQAAAKDAATTRAMGLTTSAK